MRSTLLFSLLVMACAPVAPPEVPIAPDPCAADAVLPPRDQSITLEVGGLARSFDLHVPASYDRSKTPLVLNYHGFGSNSFQQNLLSRMVEKSDAEGFLVVHPQGTGVSRPAWNAGVCCTPPNSTVDDVAFTEAILDEVSRVACVDSKRVYATGMSNGGFFSHRLACELSERIAAIAPVAGVIGIEPCTPSRPVPVMQFHGTADTIVPFDGNPSLGFVPVAESMEGWKTRNGCQGEAVQTFLNGDSHCETFDQCSSGVEVTLCTVEGGGHTWPGGFPVPSLGFTTTALSATDHMWEFFQKYSLPE